MDVPTCDLFATSDSGCCAAMCTQALAELLRGVVKVLPLRAYAATLEFNPYLGRQIVPMALKILDNFVLGMRGCGSTTASKNLRHTAGGRPPARGSASLAVTMVMAISPLVMLIHPTH